ncbi:GGDEF domain-containing protein [Pseudomonas sp. 5P_3.1_Bac2]|uniref:GGDEF domain-containing protein n=1 Tax=Pseudomonas sp. 5P_3.1_Bac2 TaxID=2971617 RepID=UPI0021C88F8B|nr:GGDEF domain-containing protein [Pseudomonas sp. 5P_3.1_Bac2]MCU1716687.1 GGDEF domain-containing protein [Pseudomonas sp. 5P_3.1_Bac2]
MVTTVIISMLCVHLLCFSVMFLLISTKLSGKKLGIDVFAVGNLLLGLAYALQLFGGPNGVGVLGFINHSLTMSAPVAYVLGAMRFFNHSTLVWRPLLSFAVLYTLLQALIYWLLGNGARHALLAGSCALLFFGMSVTALYGRRTFAKNLRIEMLIFALAIGGICVLNAAKFYIIVAEGMAALDLNSSFQKSFYLYMSFLSTLLPPSAIWLVLGRLTEELRGMAAHDPLTRLLNRRGMVDGLQAHFRSRLAGPGYLLMVDLDHFKQINDTYGHQVGDLVLCHIAEILNSSARKGDLICRLGGEEFAIIALNTDHAGALQLAERTRSTLEQRPVPGINPNAPIFCTVTIGVSEAFTCAEALDGAMQQADAALYRGKSAGRNRVEWGAI